jgi:predicted ATPase
MRLDYLKIDNYKNLRHFEIDFDQNSQTTVLVGRNGAGKSNLLEVLTIIFSELDLGEKPSIKYRIQYECRKHKVFVDADPIRDKNVYVNVDGKELTFNQFRTASNREYLPNFVFCYYSGPDARIAKHFVKHERKFFDDLVKGIDRPLRPLFYARNEHSKYALLAFFSEKDPEILKFLKENLWIEGLDSVLFVMREPPWKSKEGDPRFWKARGTVNSFLDKLYGLALAPVRMKQRVPLNFRQITTLEHLYLYLKDTDSVKELADLYPNLQEFFKALESTNKSELLRDVRIKIRVRKADGTLTFQDLSDGEKQLIMVLGLLRFTKEDESLFLLDEPDTHLNPAWSLQYIDFLRLVVGDQETSHIIMTTHDPLTIAGLERKQVQIIQRRDKDGKVVAIHPDEHPYRMGIDEILTSDLYGLRSTFSPALLKLVDRQRKLALQEKLSDDEKSELEKINAELDKYDITTSIPDPLYQPFVKAMTAVEIENELQLVALSKEQQDERSDLAKDVVRKLKKGE